MNLIKFRDFTFIFLQVILHIRTGWMDNEIRWPW